MQKKILPTFWKKMAASFFLFQYAILNYSIYFLKFLFRFGFWFDINLTLVTLSQLSAISQKKLPDRHSKRTLEWNKKSMDFVVGMKKDNKLNGN